MNFPVLIPKIFNHPFTYKSKLKIKLKPGDIVRVPFGKKKEIGVIWNKIYDPQKKISLKNIDSKINNIKIKGEFINFIEWFSSYNLIPLGKSLKLCLGDYKKIFKKEVLTFNQNSIKKQRYNLNVYQKKSLQDLKRFGTKFNVSVLQGITGSGKTIIYFERVREIIEKNKQVLIMLPEIFLTTQFEKRFKDFFGFHPSVWHSKIGLKEKRKIWYGAAQNKIKVVIGARSSLFLPFKNLGLIIVDEEHDQSYKQDEGLIYNARDMAVSRASFENIPIHLITSIPSLETFKNIKDKKYNLTKISKRFKNFNLPNTKIINLNLEKMKNKFISDTTFKTIDFYLNKGEQVLFFLNRRGYAPFLICKKCKYRHTCSKCSIYLTYHKNKNKLICHHCGEIVSTLKICNKDKKNCEYHMYGPGVEKIYEELKIKYPNKNIKIFSSDYLADKNKNTLEDIENNKVDIIVGTQMISKGFNFEKLNCIVVVDADFSGRGYDLRTTEKNIQLYNQLSGRAGRFSSESLIIYQTLSPTNDTLKDIIINNPEKFLEDEIIIRRENHLPPFCRFIAIIISSPYKNQSFLAASEIKKRLVKIENIEILGPVESPIIKLNKKYRARLLIKSKKQNMVQKNIDKVLKNLKISSKIKLKVDVDPINFA